MEQPILQIEQLTKRYPDQSQPAVNQVSFSIFPGERVGIMGANGSGKTTLFRLILNLLRPDAGTIRVNRVENPEVAKRFLGFVPEHSTGLENFTPQELLILAGQMMGMSGEAISLRAAQLLDWAGLRPHTRELISGFSKGMRQRVLLMLALLHQPLLLLLDEPMSGLDPSGQQELRRLLHTLPDQTLLLATHRLEEIEWLCDRVIILHRGKVVGDVRLSELPEQIYFLEGDSGLIRELEKITGLEIRVRELRGNREKAEFVTNQTTLEEVLGHLKRQGIPVHRIHSRSTLEELYRHYVELDS
jgi:ABC-2 type transport system ATP-binding protein